jgi:hypothetical protein
MFKRSMAVLSSILIVALGGCSHLNRPKPSAANTEMTINANGQQVAVSPSAAVSGTVHQTVTGEVKKVDRNKGLVTVRTDAGTTAVLALPRLAAATVKKGDRASFDVTITPQ